MDKTKIVYCTPSLYISGGVERVLTTKVNYLAEEAGYEIYIILTDGKGKEPYYQLSPKIHLIYLDVNFEKLWNLPFLLKIPVYLYKQGIYKKRLKKALFEIRPNVTVSLLRREINFITSIKDGSLKIGELHVNRKNYRNFEAGDTNFMKEMFAKLWMRQLIGKLRRLDRFIVLSHEDRDYWPELSNVTVISNPIPFETERQSELTSHKVIAVGRFVYQKGFDLLLKAWCTVNKRHPDWELYVYGKGDKSSYQAFADQHGLTNVHLEDAVTNIVDKYRDSSIFVLSSRFEGFVMVLIEAMSCGLPPVAFECPCGPRDAITDCDDGFLVPVGDTDAMAEKICYLMEHDQERKAMGAKAGEHIKRYNKPAIMHQWIVLFDTLLKKKAEKDKKSV